MPALKDLTSQRFGRWLVLSRAPTVKEIVHWFCRCDCGIERVVRSASLVSGASTSCGCLTRAASPICTVKDCSRPHYAHGLCALHNARMERTGTTDNRPITGAYVAKFDATTGQKDWEHRQIAERALGKPLPAKAHVHHWDGNGRNNKNRNLVICQDIAYHKLLHKRQRIKARGGDPNTQGWCYFCKALRPLSLFYRRKTGALTTFCSLCNKERKEFYA